MADWVAELNLLSVPVGPVLSVPDVLETEQITGRDLIAEVETEDETLRLCASPVRMGTQRPAPQSAPPALGADNARIWGDLGLSAQEIAELQAEGVI